MIPRLIPNVFWYNQFYIVWKLEEFDEICIFSYFNKKIAAFGIFFWHIVVKCSIDNACIHNWGDADIACMGTPIRTAHKQVEIYRKRYRNRFQISHMVPILMWTQKAESMLSWSSFQYSIVTSATCTKKLIYFACGVVWLRIFH